MGLYKDYYGIRWKNIFMTIALLVGGIFTLSIYRGGSIAISFSGIQSFLFDGVGLIRNLFVALLIILPIIIQSWAGLYEKESILLSTGIGFIIYLLFAGGISLRWALTFAWLINGGLLWRATAREHNAMKYMTGWLIFGFSSTIIAPFGNIFQTFGTKASAFWMIIAFIGIGSTFTWRTIKGEKKTAVNDAQDKNDTETKSILDETKQVATEEKLAEGMKDYTRDIEIALAKGRADEALKTAQRMHGMAQQASEIAPAQVIDFVSIITMMEKMQESSERIALKAMETLKDKNQYDNTEVGRAQQYIYELGRRILTEAETSKGNWEQFQKLKDSKFREVIEKLRATKNRRLLSYAHLLEKKGDKIWIKTFIGLTVRWIKELNQDRERNGKIVEQEFKNLEKSGREIKKIAEGIDTEFNAVKQQEEVIQKYDLKVREYYSLLSKQIDAISRAELTIEQKQAIIRDMKEKLTWITDYLPKKKKLLFDLMRHTKEIEIMIQRSQALTHHNADAQEHIERIAKETGVKAA